MIFLLAALAVFADFFTTEMGVKRGLRERFPWGPKTALLISLAGLIVCAVFRDYAHTNKILGLISVGHFGAAVFNLNVLRRHNAHRKAGLSS